MLLLETNDFESFVYRRSAAGFYRAIPIIEGFRTLPETQRAPEHAGILFWKKFGIVARTYYRRTKHNAVLGILTQGEHSLWS